MTLFVSLATNSNWQLHNEVEGIKVYTKEIEDSNLKELKIEMWFHDTSLSEILAIINDGTTYKDWLYKCMYAENIETMGKKEKIDYFQLDFPWPLSNRDIYSHSIMQYDTVKKMLLVQSDAVLDFPVKDDFVRVPSAATRWHFYIKNDRDIFLDYYTAPNPGGSIPDWMVNLVIDKGPTKSMLKLRELVGQKKGVVQPIDWLNGH